MKIRWCLSTAVVAVLVMGSAWADHHQGKEKGSGCGGAKVAGSGCSKTCGAKSDCAKSCSDQDVAGSCRVKDVVTAGAPMLKYVVGDETVCCYKKAVQTAEGDESKVRFKLGDSVYTDRSAAMSAFAERLEAYLATMTTVQYVVGTQSFTSRSDAARLARENGEPVRYRAAGVTFNDLTAAEKAAEKARSAADSVKMKLVKDGQEVACDKPVVKQAEKSCHGPKGEPTSDGGEYVLGDLKTKCPMTARIELAKAKIVAAYLAAQADNPDLAAKDAPSGS